MKFDEIKEINDKYVMNTYGRIEKAFVTGKGTKIYDTDGVEYLDFLAGIAVTNLGHSHPKIVEAIKSQADKLLHTSNLYFIEGQALLAKSLVENSNLDRVFFANSGAEANEAAIKLARKYGKVKKGGAFEIITMNKSFHGRTLTTVTATGQEKYQTSFTPLTSGFVYADFGDIESIKSKINSNTVAVMIEVIQGEGGLNIAPKEFWEELSELLKKEEILLIIDEVQTGIGRTGSLFAYELYDLKPDVITLAKGLGNGVPIGAMMAREGVSVFVPGDHASTFGGNYLVTAVANVVIDEVKEKEFIYSVRKKGQYFMDRLQGLVEKYDFVTGVRGKGLMIGLEVESSMIGDMVKNMMDKKVLIGSAGGVVLRFVPPLTVELEEIDIFIERLSEMFEEMIK